jgi:hypothetical protein
MRLATYFTNIKLKVECNHIGVDSNLREPVKLHCFAEVEVCTHKRGATLFLLVTFTASHVLNIVNLIDWLMPSTWE